MRRDPCENFSVVYGVDESACWDEGQSALRGLSANYVDRFFGGPAEAGRLADAAGAAPSTSAAKRYAHATFWRMCVRRIQESNDEGLGLTDTAVPKWTWASVFSAVNQMDDLSAGLWRFAELSAALRDDIGVTVTSTRAGLTVTYLPGERSLRHELYVECIAAAFHCVLLWITDAPLVPFKIRTSAAVPTTDGSLLESLAPMMIRSGVGVAVTYRTADLHKPLGVRKYRAWCEHETSTFLKLMSCAQSRQDEARSLLRGNAPVPYDATATAFAGRMNISVATLKRRFAQSGSSFSQHRNRNRVVRLTTLLGTPANLDDIASELGLSDRRSLWRFCRKELGVSPRKYRESLLINA